MSWAWWGQNTSMNYEIVYTIHIEWVYSSKTRIITIVTSHLKKHQNSSVLKTSSPGLYPPQHEQPLPGCRAFELLPGEFIDNMDTPGSSLSFHQKTHPQIRAPNIWGWPHYPEPGCWVKPSWFEGPTFENLRSAWIHTHTSLLGRQEWALSILLPPVRWR